MYEEELYHHGIKGQKWGIRRYQNPDGSLTEEGRRRYLKVDKITARGRREFSKDPEAYRKFAVSNYKEDMKLVRSMQDVAEDKMGLSPEEMSMWNLWTDRAETKASKCIANLEQRSVQDLQKDAKKAKGSIHEFFNEQYSEIFGNYLALLDIQGKELQYRHD